MKYKITKLDKRYNGHLRFAYCVSPVTSGIQGAKDLVELRNWCWENYGPSTELEWAEQGAIWAWDTQFHHKRIYLKGEAESTFFLLKYVG